MGQRLCPGFELVQVRGIAGDVFFIDAVGTHLSPLVVVAAQPDFRDG